MEIYIITQIDSDDSEQTIIGVADSVEKANEMINEYYGDFKEITYDDVRDSGIEYAKTIEVINADDPYKVGIILETFNLNEI